MMGIDESVTASVSCICDCTRDCVRVCDCGRVCGCVRMSPVRHHQAFHQLLNAHLLSSADEEELFATLRFAPDDGLLKELYTVQLNRVSCSC
jgi:hypothetical protein